MGSLPCHSQRNRTSRILVSGHGIGGDVRLILPVINILLTVCIIPSAASETVSPRRNIAKAVDRVFWRILVFYVSMLHAPERRFDLKLLRSWEFS